MPGNLSETEELFKDRCIKIRGSGEFEFCQLLGDTLKNLGVFQPGEVWRLTLTREREENSAVVL